MKHFTTGIALFAIFISATKPCSTAAVQDDDFVSVFNGKDLSGWKAIIDGKKGFGKTFTVRDGIMVVSGHPNGYIYTDKSYHNYVLRFDWRYKRPAGLTDEESFPGNSGLLVHIQPPHRIWPKCVEVQGMNRDHGMILALGGAKGQNLKFDRTALKKARNSVGDWNTTEVAIRNGAITCKVNGVTVSSGQTDLMAGPFGYQSEGAELHFKNIKVKVLE